MCLRFVSRSVLPALTKASASSHRWQDGERLTSMEQGKYLCFYFFTRTSYFLNRFADILQFVSVPLRELSQCVELYKKQRVTLTNNQLCAGGEKGG